MLDARIGTPTAIPLLDLAATHNELTDEFHEAVRRVLDSSVLIGGEEVERFEQDWAAYCGVAHAIGMASGTDALHLTLRGLGIGPGYEVIVPSNTFVATAEAVVLAGATPRFVDVDPASLLLDPERVAAALTPRCGAIMAVHLYGTTPDMDKLVEVSGRAGVALIEDAAQAHGAEWRGRRAGSFGVAGCFSFYPGKNLGALGDAGAVVTGDAALAKRIRSLGDHGRSPESRFVHQFAGTTSRLDALQAAFLSAKLPQLDSWVQARRDIVSQYRQKLAGSPVRFPTVPDGAISASHLAVVRAPRRDAVRDMLAQVSIATGVHYPVPCHQQPAYAAYSDESFPGVERAAREVLSLPLSPHLTVAQLERVVEAVWTATASKGAADEAN